MSEIALRTYVEQLDTLIERKQIDEVVAHCRHLLSYFPKHLDTYRMLGKALLEKGRHGDAADIFQRVLSVMPDDFIAHVGMSIVREDEANLDAAIWHMERAFEAAPANGAIQQELCRLYGRRDGVVPTKARLTRGALARMYTQGGLYLQAEAELRSALADEADRIDLLTVLARVYWQSDQPAQAAQTCAGILQKLPYSLEGNRILYGIFRAQGRPDDATVYRQRVEALDPYEAFAEPSASRRVDANKITLDRLEYAPGMEDTGSPDWLASIGAKFEDPSARPAEAQPAWLNPTPEPIPEASPNVPGTAELPDWLRELQPPAPVAAEPAAAPDWLRDIGLGTSPLPAQASGTADLPDWLKTATGPLSEEAVPEWMRPALEEPAAPAAPTAEAAPAAPAPAPEPPAALPPITGDEVPAWLLGAAVVAKAVLPIGDEAPPVRANTDDDLPEWMRTITPPAAEAGPAADAEAEAVPAWMRGPAELDPQVAEVAAPAPAEPQPEWVQARAALEATDADPEPESDTDALPEWLQARAEPPTTEAMSAEPPMPATSAAPEGMSPAAPTAMSSEDTWVPIQPEAKMPAAQMPAADITETIVPGALMTSPADEVPEWLRPGAPADADEPPGAEPEWLNALKDASTPKAPALPAADLPDWLKAAAPAGAATGPAEEIPAWLREAGTAPDADDVPEWMKPAEAAEATVETPAPSVDVAAPAPAEAVAEPAPAPEAEPAAEMPAWLSAMAPVAAAMTPAEMEPAAPADDEVPAWLRPGAEAGAVASDAVPPQPTAATEPASDDDGVPAWLRALPAAGAAPPAPPQVPDWLRAVAADAPSPDPQAPGAPASAKPPVELPDYLQLASPEAIARAEQPFELQGEDEEPLDSEPLEPDLVLPAEIPEWLRALAPVTPDPEAPISAVASVAAETPAAAAAAPGPEADETLDWLASLTAQPVTSGVAAEEITPDLPPWAEAAAPGPTDTIVTWLAGRSSATQSPPPAAPEPVAPEHAVEPEPSALEVTPSELPPWAEPQAPGPTDTIVSWLAAKETPTPAAEPAAVEPAPLEPSAASDLDGDEAMRWLESLAARQGANPDELLTTPEERLSETPAWIAAELATATAEQAAEPAAPDEPALAATPAEELPDWLRALEPAAGQDPIEPAFAAAQLPVEPAATPPADMPDWLRALEPAAGVEAITPTTLEPPAPADMPVDETPAWLRPEVPAAALSEAVAAETPVAEAPTEPEAEPETPSWLTEALAGAGAIVGAGALAVASAASAEPEPVEPTVPTVLAAPVAEAPVAGPDALESWLSQVEAANPVDPFADTSPRPPRSVPAAPVETAPVEPTLAAFEAPSAAALPVAGAEAEPDLAAMDTDEAMRWLEGLAVQQGANPEELLTKPEERPAETPAWIVAEQVAAERGAAQAEPTAEMPVSEGGDDEPAAQPTPYDELPEWLREAMPTPGEAPIMAPEAVVEPALAEPSLTELAGPVPAELDDTGPMRAVVATIAQAEAPAEAEPPITPSADALGDEEALGWLESLAVRQGANPEELLTAPDERPAETPAWIAAEVATAATAAAAALTDTPAELEAEPQFTEPQFTETMRPEWLPADEAEPAPVAAAPAEADVAAMDEDQALRWLEGLAAQQGAKPEDLLTTPAERLTETPAWIAAEVATAAAEAALEPEPVAEPEPVEAITPPTWLAAEEASEETLAIEPLSPELQAALAQEDEQPAVADEPPAPSGTADFGKLARLSERLATARRARESEIEARFAEQRAQQEAARREVEERMAAWREAMEAEAVAKAEAARAEPVAAAPVVTPPPVTAPLRLPPTAPAATPYVRPHAVPTAAPRPTVVLPDYAAAMARLAPQVEAGADLDHTIRELEGLANVEQAPAPVLRLLGDAYVKAERLPRALDAYRQALSRL